MADLGLWLANIDPYCLGRRPAEAILELTRRQYSSC